jgi:hypothetical protein
MADAQAAASAEVESNITEAVDPSPAEADRSESPNEALTVL